MKKFTIFMLMGLFLTACGGAASTNSAKSNTNSNSNSAANQTNPASTDSAPVTMDKDAFKAADAKTLESYKGRTLIVKGGEVIEWSEFAMTVKPSMNRFVQCSGDFSSYKDSIKIWGDAKIKPDIYADVKGTVKEIEDRSDVIVKLENCVLQKLDK